MKNQNFTKFLCALFVTLSLTKHAQVHLTSKDVFHPKESHEKHECNHEKHHLVNDYFTEGLNLYHVVKEAKEKINIAKLNYSNTNISFEKAFSLLFKKESFEIREIAYDKKDLNDLILKELFYELFDKTIANINNKVLIKNLYDREVYLKLQYELGTGYSHRPTQACTNANFLDGTTNGWQCSWGTGAANQYTTVIGTTTSTTNDCSLFETFNSGTGQCCVPIFGPCRAAVISTVITNVVASYNNPAVTNAPNTGPVNSNANSGTGGVHTIMTGGTDPNIPAISVVPPGGGNSVRLGNAVTGAYKAQIIKQNFLVTASNPNFVYQYAVLLENPTTPIHTVRDMPYLKIRMYDGMNNEIDCASYDVNSITAPTIGGFITSGGVLYKNWSSVYVPLLPYVGQNITIEFTTSDCALSGHYGYAYINASCNAGQIVSSLPVVCNGQNTTLRAPSGAASYSWTSTPAGAIISGANTQTAVVNVSGTFSVTMTTLAVPPQVPCSITQTISLPGAPGPATPNFSVTTACLGAPNNFTDLSTGVSIITYSWNYGDGSTGVSSATSINPNHTYTSAATYTASLMVDNGCPATFTLPVIVNPQPLANFTFTSGCLNASSTFTSTSTPFAGISSHVWSWGDATANGSGSTTTHNYSSPGSFPVNLIVTASVGGCTATVTRTLTVAPNPIIAFTSNTVCLGATTNFNNTSSVVAPSNIVTWAWDFDNNGTVDNSTQSPTNTFATAGTFNVELKATTNSGCRDSLVIPIRVNANPTASFTPINACENANVVLNNNSTVPLSSTIALHNWNFGSGATPATNSNQTPPSLTYATSGIKTITLTVTANTSCTASITNTVTIYPSPISNFSATSVCQSTTTTYTDLSTISTGAINTWNWDFTNNASIDNSTQNPTFVFPSSGTFTTALTVTSTNLCSNTKTLVVNVWGRSIPDFSPDRVCFGTLTTFTNNTNTTTNANVGGALTYAWNFADATATVSATNPAHTFLLGGNANAIYNVTLTATTSNGCINNISKLINVYSTPTASFTSNVVCLGNPTNLLDASNGNGNVVNGFIWDFLSNGTIDATGFPNPNFVFPNFGVNTVSYTVSTTPVAGLTCRNTTNTITVFVNPLPNPNFTFVNKCINAQPNTFDGSSSTIAIGTNTAYAWSYGDATNGNGITTINNYNTAGIFNVTLTVTSDNGCVKSITKPVEVYQKPILTIDNSSACLADVMTFTSISAPNSGNVVDWQWSFSNTTNTGAGFTTSNTYPSAGQQTVTLIAQTNNGCIETFIKTVYVDYVPQPLFTVNDPDGCPIHCVVFTNNTAPIIGPAVNSEWKWEFGDGTDVVATNGNTQNHCYNNKTSNQLNLFDVKLTVTTNKGCFATLIKNSFITVYPTPIANYTVTPNPGSILTPLEEFTNYSQDYVKWWWSFGDGPKIDSINRNPTHFYSEISSNSYYSNLIVQNQYGCRDTANVKVEILPEFTFYIPNAFSPENGDGINDTFTGYGIGIAKYEMWIFDRWGTNIFYTNDITKGWDGKVQGNPLHVKQDVYVWKVKLIDVLGKKHNYIGHVTELR